jgi:hypothetical protein
MTPGFTPARRALARLLAALVVVAAAMPTPVLAQDPQSTFVQKVARDWLALIDGESVLDSWGAAGSKFKQAITPARWGESLQEVRAPFGALEQRTMLATSFSKTLPGAPDGDYALVQFRTTFAKKTAARETVTLERETDGAWRVIGYFIR